MRNIRSKGVTILAWSMIIVNIFLLLAAFDFNKIAECYRSFGQSLIVVIIVYSVLSALIGIVAGFGILKLKEIMRKTAVIINSLDVVIGITLLFVSINDLKQYCYSVVVTGYDETLANIISLNTLVNLTFYITISVYLFFMALSLLYIFFFSRPKVKEQFK